jgi:ubiquinone/menaquinone biosynthesis C-methylase UbiE
MKDATLNVRAEEDLLEVILGSDSFQEAMQQIGISGEAARNRALEIVRMDFIEGNWTTFANWVRQVRPDALAGPILDLGCGKGNTVYYGLAKQYDVWGIDIDQDGNDFYRERVRLSQAPSEWAGRCLVADAREMPFETDYFCAVYSNYVLEHIVEVGEVLRETVRATQKGGVIFVKAQDARISYEGHYCIPWLPFMPKHLARIWLEEFGKPDGYLEHFHYVTTPQAVAILEACGCQVVARANAPETVVSNHWQIHMEEEVRMVARRAKELFEQGLWPRQAGSLFVIAVKHS